MTISPHIGHFYVIVYINDTNSTIMCITNEAKSQGLLNLRNKLIKYWGKQCQILQ